MRILVVEDHPDTLMVLQRLLQREGHEVVTAATLAEGMKACENGPFHVLLADIGLPDGSGLDLARQFNRRCAGGVAVALTGFASEDNLSEVRSAGFEHSLVKPLAFPKLTALLRDIVTKLDQSP